VDAVASKSYNILNPEEVKEFVAEKEAWRSAKKLLTVKVYRLSPAFRNNIMPIEQEINTLITGRNKLEQLHNYSKKQACE
jgi:hypothetical protein